MQHGHVWCREGEGWEQIGEREREQSDFHFLKNFKAVTEFDEGESNREKMIEFQCLVSALYFNPVPLDKTKTRTCGTWNWTRQQPSNMFLVLLLLWDVCWEHGSSTKIWPNLYSIQVVIFLANRLLKKNVILLENNCMNSLKKLFSHSTFTAQTSSETNKRTFEGSRRLAAKLK